MQNKIRKYIGLSLVLLLLSGSLNSSDVNAQELNWHSFDEALMEADITDQPVLVDVGAPWCGWCHKMKKEVYPSLAPELRNQFVVTRLNRDNHTETYHYKGEKLTSHRLAQKLNAETVPTVIILTSSGDYLLHLSGFVEAQELRPVLKYVSSEAYQYQEFQDFISQKRF